MLLSDDYGRKFCDVCGRRSERDATECGPCVRHQEAMRAEDEARDRECHAAGVRAFLDGLSRAQCPYRSGSDLFSWGMGWDYARTSRAVSR